MLGCGWGKWVEQGGPSKKFAGLNFFEKKKAWKRLFQTKTSALQLNR